MARVAPLVEAGVTSFSVNPPAGADTIASIGAHLQALVAAFPS